MYVFVEMSIYQGKIPKNGIAWFKSMYVSMLLFG
jgi:hypothetical protein